MSSGCFLYNVNIGQITGKYKALFLYPKEYIIHKKEGAFYE